MLRIPRFLASFVLAGLMGTSTAGAQGLRVADREMKLAAGFSEDAEMYVAPSVADGSARAVGKAFGTSATSYMSQGNMFQPRTSTGAYTTAIGQGDIAYSGGEQFWDMRVDVPSGGIWEGSAFWGNDANAAQDLFFFLIRVCVPAEGPGTPVVTVVGTGHTTGSGGNYYLVVPAEPDTVIDNSSCVYYNRVRFDAVGHGLFMARTQWHRQVSPAPALATFNDVPVSHPFFRWIEAFARAGITAGCGGGNYCPDGPLTRGQMAVFLSIALGLHFPN